jgi:hypothetical protein
MSFSDKPQSKPAPSSRSRPALRFSDQSRAGSSPSTCPSKALLIFIRHRPSIAHQSADEATTVCGDAREHRAKQGCCPRIAARAKALCVMAPPRENAACRDRSFPIARREKRRSSRLHARPHQRTQTISAMLITCALVGTHGTIKRDSFPQAPPRKIPGLLGPTVCNPCVK